MAVISVISSEAFRRISATSPALKFIAYHYQAMDTTEIEFLAEKEIVTVVSNFSMDKIYLIGVNSAFSLRIMSMRVVYHTDISLLKPL